MVELNFQIDLEVIAYDLYCQDALVHSLKELEDLLSSGEWTSKINEVFNIGGAEIYRVWLGFLMKFH